MGKTKMNKDVVYAGSTNVHHWLVLLDLFPSKEPKSKSQVLACYADPLEKDWVVWSWPALRASRVLHAFKITKP